MDNIKNLIRECLVTRRINSCKKCIRYKDATFKGCPYKVGTYEQPPSPDVVIYPRAIDFRHAKSAKPNQTFLVKATAYNPDDYGKQKNFSYPLRAFLTLPNELESTCLCTVVGYDGEYFYCKDTVRLHTPRKVATNKVPKTMFWTFRTK